MKLGYSEDFYVKYIFYLVEGRIILNIVFKVNLMGVV